MNSTETSARTFVWDGDAYPLIADLPDGWKLVGHKNAPAITDGYRFEGLDQSDEDDEDVIKIKRAAYAKFEKWAWRQLAPNLTCPTYE